MRPARSREELDPASEGDAAYSLDTKGVPATRRERIEAAVEAGGKHLVAPPEGWIATDPFKGGIRVLITGSQALERVVQFGLDDQPSEITRRVRETLED